MSSPLDRAASPSPYNPDTDPSSDVSYSRSVLQQSATLTSNDAAIQQREREITDIAEGIMELADIFKDLQAMVIDQGTMLDRIDYNVEQMNVHVKEADKEMTIVRIFLCRCKLKQTTNRNRLLVIRRKLQRGRLSSSFY
jgi:syntaxin 16